MDKKTLKMLRANARQAMIEHQKNNGKPRSKSWGGESSTDHRKNRRQLKQKIRQGDWQE